MAGLVTWHAVGNQMKLQTLRKYFKRSKRTKLYITTDAFLISGYVYNPREEKDSLLVDIGPYIIFSFGRKEILQSSGDFKALCLTAETKITRRIQTHRRHLQDREYPQEYFQLAWDL